MESYEIFAGVIAAYLGVRIGVALFFRAFQKQLREAKPRIQPLIGPVHALIIVGLVHFGLAMAERSTLIVQLLLVLAATWTAIRLIVVLIAELYFRALRGIVMPAVLRAITSYALYLLAAFTALHLFWGMAIGDLLVIASVAALVCGVVFQSTIGTLLTGLSISLRYPLSEGDIIRVAGVEGRVRDVDWRFAELITRDNAIVTLPNRLLAESMVLNYARPDPRHRSTIEISADASAPPNRVKQILIEAVLSATELSTSAAETTVYFVSEQNGQITYSLSFWTINYERARELEDRVRTLVWYRLRREKLETAAPSNYLGNVAIFAGVSPDHLERLSSSARTEMFGKGEQLFRQGEAGDSFFVVRSGAISISTDTPASDFQEQRAVLRSGEVFGERSVLTGEPRSANAAALEDSELIVIHKHNLLELLQADPNAAERISAIMVAREQENASAPANAADVERTRTGLLRKIRRVFNL